MSTELPPKIKRKRLPQTTSPNERFFSCNLIRLSIAAIRRKLLAKLALAAAARMLYRHELSLYGRVLSNGVYWALFLV